ncbi:hypothetical protein N431DRAFT_44374 [Stipitochalara longipes BDJ]|nr:hypothetical protein N431DRAFT_44374 [Stipitochalara longipes BDJ]
MSCGFLLSFSSLGKEADACKTDSCIVNHCLSFKSQAPGTLLTHFAPSSKYSAKKLTHTLSSLPTNKQTQPTSTSTESTVPNIHPCSAHASQSYSGIHPKPLSTLK